MRFIIKFAFWMAVTLHLLPDVDISTPLRQTAVPAISQTSKYEFSDSKRCSAEFLSCLYQVFVNYIIKSVDIDQLWKSIKQSATK